MKSDREKAMADAHPDGWGDLFIDHLNTLPEINEAMGRVAKGRSLFGEASFSVRKRGEKTPEEQKRDQDIATREGVKVGDHGPIFTAFRHDADGAIAQLKKYQTGEAIAALHHPEVGDIDLVWGEKGNAEQDGYGLAKLIDRHGDIVPDLQTVLSSMRVRERNSNSIILESPNHEAVIRLNWFGKDKRWLLTAYKKTQPSSAGRTIDVSGKPEGPAGRQAPQPEGGSTDIIGGQTPEVKADPEAMP